MNNTRPVEVGRAVANPPVRLDPADATGCQHSCGVGISPADSFASVSELADSIDPVRALQHAADRVDRSPELDFRIALHECGHAIVHRIFGDEVHGVTIVANEYSDGRTWGPYALQAGATAFWDAETGAPANLHQPGRPLESDVDGVFASVQRGVIAMMGGCAAEMAFLGDPPMYIAGDVPNANWMAEMVCRTSASVAAFVEHGYQEALAIVEQNKAVVRALACALVQHPDWTLNAIEIDQVISDTVYTEARKAEIARRADWHHVETNAATFAALNMETAS
jgi:hypothetical protein